MVEKAERYRRLRLWRVEVRYLRSGDRRRRRRGVIDVLAPTWETLYIATSVRRQPSGDEVKRAALERFYSPDEVLDVRLEDAGDVYVIERGGST